MISAYFFERLAMFYCMAIVLSPVWLGVGSWWASVWESLQDTEILNQEYRCLIRWLDFILAKAKRKDSCDGPDTYRIAAGGGKVPQHSYSAISKGSQKWALEREFGPVVSLYCLIILSVSKTCNPFKFFSPFQSLVLLVFISSFCMSTRRCLLPPADLSSFVSVLVIPS